jgi:hypothetical protein
MRHWAEHELDPGDRALLAQLLAPGIAAYVPRPDGDGFAEWEPLADRLAAAESAPSVRGLTGPDDRRSHA